MFSEKDRLIYQCPATGLFFDPLAVKRKLIVSGRGRINEAFVTYGTPDAPPDKRSAAESMIVACGRAAFDLKPVDPKTGEGVLDAQVIEAVTAFTRWLRGKGGPAQSGPNSVPCTDCPPAAN